MNPTLIAKIQYRLAVTSLFRPFMIIAGTLLLLIAGVTSSCNTTRGLGQDIEITGEEIQEAARR